MNYISLRIVHFVRSDDGRRKVKRMLNVFRKWLCLGNLSQAAKQVHGFKSLSSLPRSLVNNK